MQVFGPFFNDPPAPAGPPSQPFPQLWNYEGERFMLKKYSSSAKMVFKDTMNNCKENTVLKLGNAKHCPWLHSLYSSIVQFNTIPVLKKGF